MVLAGPPGLSYSLDAPVTLVDLVHLVDLFSGLTRATTGVSLQRASFHYPCASY